MYSQYAIEAFLKQNDLPDWKFVKQLTKPDLQSLLPEFQFKTEPYLYQLACFFIGVACPRFVYTLNMGTGKSFIAINLLSYYQIKKALVVVPNEVNVGNWQRELKKHSDFTSIGLVGTRQERFSLIQNDAQVNIINYDGLKVYMAILDKGSGYEIDEKLADKFVSQFDAVVYDEIHLVKNRNTLNWNLCEIIAQHCKYVYGLTGTPFGRKAEDLWSQFFLIDRGVALGRTISFFRQAFFNTKVNFWGGYEYELIKRKEPILNRRLRSCSIHYTDEEISDLPPVVYTQVPLNLSIEALELYKKAIDGVIQSKGDFHSIENSFIRLIQITSGFLSFKNMDGLRIESIFETNPKLDALVEIIRETPENSGVVVFTWHVMAGQLIEQRLQEEKIKSVRLYGETKNKQKVLDRFLDGKVKVLNANIKTGSLGLNLQEVANYGVYYEIPVPPIDRKQSLKRLHRIGQKKRVYIYDLVMQRTIDVKILASLEQGKNLFHELIEKGYDILL